MLPCSYPSPFLAKWTYFLFEHPGVARLLIELPIGLGDRCRRHQAVRIEVVECGLAFALPDALAHPRGVHAGIDNEMGDVDILGPKLAGSGLRHRAQTELGAGKGRVTNAAAKARRRSGKEDAAAAAWHHPPRGLPPGEKSRIARHLPDLAEHALGRVEQGKVHVRADVEDAHLKWRVLIGVRQERDD